MPNVKPPKRGRPREPEPTIATTVRLPKSLHQQFEALEQASNFGSFSKLLGRVLQIGMANVEQRIEMLKKNPSVDETTATVAALAMLS